jgi:hypothetical protein
VFVGIGFALGLLSFVVGRARIQPAALAPYAGQRGASQARAAGLEVRYQRGDEVRALEPGVALQSGDVLGFVVRGERPRYLSLRLGEAGAPAATVFPPGGDVAWAVLVQPGDKLPVAPRVGPGGDKLVVSATFADHPFPAAAEPPPDAQVVSIVIPRAR